MVDMQELRKGNLVKCLSHLPIGYYVPAFPHTEILEIKNADVETDAGSHKYKDIAPIPLTENLLLMSGGIKADNVFTFRIDETDLFPLSLWLEDGKFYLGVANQKQSVAIDSVHHFQNLYFAIKGKEIKIKGL